jgi:low affinity Fe/Cu permease
MDCLIQNAIEPHMERIYRKLVELERKIDNINKKIEKIDKIDNDLLGLDMKIDKLANPANYKSTMEDVD